MKKQISLPIPLLFSSMIACFLFGAIIGTIVTYLLIDPTQKEVSHENQQIILPEKAWVKEVIDGDTITVIADQREIRIRYLGIDCPENKIGSPPVYYAQEAYQRNKDWVEGKTIKIQWDREFYEERQGAGFGGRLRGYVYIDDIFVNAEMIRQGFASVYRRQKESLKHLHYKEFEKLEVEAQTHQRGIWNTKGKEVWEEEHRLDIVDNPAIYIADDQIFHRPECPRVQEIRFKRYYYQREKAIKELKACTICKP